MKTLSTNTIFYSSIILFVMVMLGFGWQNSKLDSSDPILDLSGKVVKIENGWGLKADWDPFRPFAIRLYRITNLPKDLEVPGKSIHGVFGLRKLTLGHKWGAEISIISL